MRVAGRRQTLAVGREAQREVGVGVARINGGELFAALKINDAHKAIAASNGKEHAVGA